MGATDSEERTIANLRFGAASPATWYFGLSTTVPNDDGTNFTEPATGSYARVSKTNDSTNFPDASTTSGVTSKSNGTAITFPNPTADWGTIVAYGIFTASSGGTPSYVFELDAAITVKNGNTPVEFAIGAVVLKWD